MDVATNSNKNGKRVHFSPMENLSPSNPISTTAIDVAKTSITIALMLLPPAISSLAEPLCMEFTKLLKTKNVSPRIWITFLIWHALNLNSEPVQGSWSIMVINLRPWWNKLNNALLCFNCNYATPLFHLLNWKLPPQEIPLLCFIVKQ